MAEAPIKKVCLIGANGTLGSVILNGLVQANCFDVSILKRANSSSNPVVPSGTSVAQLTASPELGLEELTEAFTGQDAVILSFPLKDVDVHLRIVEAAFRAGVRRLIPADFGSCDAASPAPQKYLPLYRKKTLVRTECERLAGQAEKDGRPFSWTAIVCGHFFDQGLKDGLLHFNLDTRTAHILDKGTVKASASTLRRIAEATARVLQKPAETKNRAIYIQSFCPTQLEVLAALERATGQPWTGQHLDSKAYLDLCLKKVEGGDRKAVEDVVFVLGTVDADWTLKDGLAMETLGLQDEVLDEVVAEVVAEHKANVVR